MKSHHDQTHLDLADKSQKLEAKHAVAKSFLRTPSGNFNLQQGTSKPRGTSIGKYWENKTCDSARDYSMTHSELFTQTTSAKELPFSNGKYSSTNANHKFFKKVEFKEVDQEEKQEKKESTVLNFSKTPKSYKTQKTESQSLQFSHGKAIRSKKALEQINLEKSTQNSDNSHVFERKDSLLGSSNGLKFKTTSKLSLSQLVDKDTFETQLHPVEMREQPSYQRRGSFSIDEKQSNNRGEGLPTHVVTRQIAGGTFSNSYPTNNPFLKFKAQSQSKIFSNQNMNKFSSSGFESRQFHSEKDVYKPRRKPIKKDEFDIGKRLGKGKYGDVFLVRHRELGFICAMKIIQKDLVKRQNVQNQISREMKISNFINHPNLTTLYGYFHDQSNIYLLLELCSGGNLFQLMKDKKRLPQNIVVTGIKQICQGVEYLHTENIIHRDIKPENIIVQNGFLKLCDFGWAVYCQDRLRSTFCGTPLYVSPEVLKGDDYNQTADIWAIGILTYELLIGRVPFKINSEADMAKIIYEQVQFPEYVNISNLAKDFILRILDRDTSKRIDIQQVLNHPFLKQQCPDLFFLS